MANKIIINDGFKTYDIENQDGKLLGQFSFNPSDTNIVNRYNKAVENFQKVFEDMKESNDVDENIDLLKQLDDRAYELIDNVFNADISKDFFAIMGPFTPLASGQYFIESVIDAIGQAIQAETGERVKKINSKIKKHTSKYHG